jgi:hypothetical protein
MSGAELTDEELHLVHQLGEWAKAFSQLQSDHSPTEAVSLAFHLDGLRNMVLARAAHRSFGSIPDLILGSEQLE